MKTMHPFFHWFGSKWRLSAELPPPLPGAILEAFAGSAGYATRYGAGKRVFLADINPNIQALWRWLIHNATKEAISEIPSNTYVRNYSYTTHTSSVRCGSFGGALYEGLNLDADQIRLLKSWQYSKAGNAVFNAKSIPKHGGYWTDIVKQNIIEQLPFIKYWSVYKNYESLPDVVGTWIVDPPYQAHSSDKLYNSRPIDYEKLAAWCRSRRGFVIAHDVEGATWLPFRPFRSIRNSNIHGGVIVSKEVIWTNRWELFKWQNH